nr:Chain B, Transient receptor potential cation channel subfamily V member 3 [Homo sapiens]7QQN_D Chain D, Transient receptor potential cation channel subfamily V member 3 [Homo sapiens]
EVEEFPETSV